MRAIRGSLPEAVTFQTCSGCTESVLKALSSLVLPSNKAYESKKGRKLDDLAEVPYGGSEMSLVRFRELSHVSTPTMTGRRFQRTMEIIPALPGSLKALLFPPLSKKVSNKEMQGVQARYATVLWDPLSGSHLRARKCMPNQTFYLFVFCKVFGKARMSSFGVSCYETPSFGEQKARSS